MILLYLKSRCNKCFSCVRFNSKTKAVPDLNAFAVPLVYAMDHNGVR